MLLIAYKLLNCLMFLAADWRKRVNEGRPGHAARSTSHEDDNLNYETEGFVHAKPSN